MSHVALRTKMIMQITENANQIRHILGKKPMAIELESLFEDMMIKASDSELLDLLIHSVKDVEVQKSKVGRDA